MMVFSRFFFLNRTVFGSGYTLTLTCDHHWYKIRNARTPEKAPDEQAIRLLNAMFGCTGSNWVGIPCYEWLKRGMLSSFRKNYSAIGDAMFKGGLMEPNGILCEVQPVL